MKQNLLRKLISILIIILTLFSAVTVSAAESSDPPAGYVITDGELYYWLDFNELFLSYLSYRIDENSEGGKLAKFYFDTLGGDVMSSMAAYVSGVTTKFVSYNAIFMEYLITRDVDETYIWFNSSDSADATPAFDVITEVMIMGPEATITGKVYVGTDGYIITIPSPGITIPGIKYLRIDADTTNVNVTLGNPTDNPCYFVISIILDDGSVIYESDMLAPGEILGDIEISEALAHGEHKASILYEAFDLSDQSPLNSAEVKITIIAE